MQALPWSTAGGLRQVVQALLALVTTELTTRGDATRLQIQAQLSQRPQSLRLHLLLPLALPPLARIVIRCYLGRLRWLGSCCRLGEDHKYPPIWESMAPWVPSHCAQVLLLLSWRCLRFALCRLCPIHPLRLKGGRGAV